ncbi:hypothetical protein HYT24_02415 [Candidatus Pacearchaeota archaeon]|nr:hypothetical protein [Candidatus Pacearchaeota archaeon]
MKIENLIKIFFPIRVKLGEELSFGRHNWQDDSPPILGHYYRLEGYRGTFKAVNCNEATEWSGYVMYTFVREDPSSDFKKAVEKFRFVKFEDLIPPRSGRS